MDRMHLVAKLAEKLRKNGRIDWIAITDEWQLTESERLLIKRKAARV